MTVIARVGHDWAAAITVSLSWAKISKIIALFSSSSRKVFGAIATQLAAPIHKLRSTITFISLLFLFNFFIKVFEHTLNFLVSHTMYLSSTFHCIKNIGKTANAMQAVIFY